MARSAHAVSTKSHRILIVDDHPIVREGLIKFLQREPDLVACGEAENAAEAMQAIAVTRPNLAIVDLSLRDRNGLDLTRAIKRRHPNLPVLILSMHDENVYAERALRAGARGYVMKDKAKELIVLAVRAVLKGEIYISPRMAQNMLAKAATGEPASGNSPIDLLSDREMEIFQMLGQGLGTKDIAARLQRSAKTIDTHRENIKHKLKLDNATELLQHAIRWTQSESPL